MESTLNANEFRIGNLLQDKVSKTLLEVVGLSKNNIDTYVIDRLMFPLPMGWKAEPITITEESLLSFGFEKNDNTSFFNYYLKKDRRTTFVAVSLDFNVVEISHAGHGFSVNVKYVHQLQNLYFALTCEELKKIPNA